ncbi:MAG: DNA adenine methylase [Eubacteriales bacterium]
MTAKPFVKWAGGKGQLLPKIRKAYPAGLGVDITKYAEPFVGGGAVLFDILSNYNGITDVYISDINAELINTYIMIRDRAAPLIKRLAILKNEFMGSDCRKEYYYQKREEFNALKTNGDIEENLEKAALLIFFNKTCFNGLYRVNRKGEFNVPMGSYKNPTICDEENIEKVSSLLQKVEIVCGDYKYSENFIDKNTFVYFDPPYRPLSETASFTSYTEDGFSDTKQKELAKFIKLLTNKGAKIVLSNSDPKNSDKQDDFFDELYSTYNINRVQATRMINSNSALRGKINELIISNFGV